METRVKELTRALKSYDRCLFAKSTHPGRIDIYRSSQFMCNPPHFLFSLTEDWTVKSKPREWGIEVVLNRIKAQDLWRDDTFVENLIKTHEKIDESADRDLSNSIESFFYDFRRQFARATDDINTASMKKLYRKENSHGYCEPRS